MRIFVVDDEPSAADLAARAPHAQAFAANLIDEGPGRGAATPLAARGESLAAFDQPAISAGAS